MLEFVVRVDAPAGSEDGIREKVSMDFERYGDVRIVSVRVIEPEQLRMDV